MRAADFRYGVNSATVRFLAALAGMGISAETPAYCQTADTSVEDLQRQLRQRDAIIQDLIRRVQKLERQAARGGLARATQPVAQAPPLMSSPRSGASSTAGTEPPLQGEETPGPATAQAAPPPPPQPSNPNPPAPGQFEVSEESAERALERTLVATGNLVLPEGFAEIQPVFIYQRNEVPTQVLFNVNRNLLIPALGARVGLPWESQVDMSLPWNFAEQTQTDNAVSPPQLVSNHWGNAIGDLTIGATKTLLHEEGWVPGLLGRVSYEIPTGPLLVHGAALTGGQSRLNLSLTGLKRQDPLVFVATGTYTKSFQVNQINPGDQASFNIAAFLATSPETTLRGVLSQTFTQDLSIRGVTIPGSNTVQSLLTFGASSILGRGILLDLQAGVGLTTAAPKYQVVLSGTYRFPVTGQ